MRLGACLLGIGLGVALVACRAPFGIADQRPDAVPSDALASTVWVGSPTQTGISGFASAVVLGPRTLLTNAHVWAVEEPWWEGELPSRRSLALFERGARGRVRLDGEDVEVELPGRIVEVEFTLVAAGEPRRGAGGDSPHPTEQQLLEDWVLLETRSPRWEPRTAATPHAQAGDAAWNVPEGSELLVAGYSSIFGDEVLRSGGGRRGEAQAQGLDSLLSHLSAGPYCLVGEALELDGLPAVSYPAEWPPPEGHSGGGVYLWDAATGRAWLVGVFHTCVPTRSIVTQRYAPFGLGALSFERSTQQDGQVLVYTPLAAVRHQARSSTLRRPGEP